MSQSVVITGASSGIGAACALHLDAAGWRVFAGVRREADAHRLRGEASERLETVYCEVTDPVSIEAARVEVEAGLSGAPLDGLVNNAGLAVPGPIEVLPLEALRRQFEVNVLGQVAVTQAFLPLLRRGKGRIVNMSSVSGRQAYPLLGAYAGSKFALEALSDALRMELREWGIGVSIIEPGAVVTPIWERSAKTAADLLAGIDPADRDRYGVLNRGMRAIIASAVDHAVAPEVVARAVEHALAAPRPRTRYRIGRDARLQRLLALLPTRLVDRLILNAIRRAGSRHAGDNGPQP